MIRFTKKVTRSRVNPVYNIGMVSKLTGLPIWTLRWIEGHELLTPQRTGGNQRLFSDEEIDLLNEIRELMEKRVNLPGIRIILEMRNVASRKIRKEVRKNGKRTVPTRTVP